MWISLGMDAYKRSKSDTFESFYGNFYKKYAKNKLFLIGKTGTTVKDSKVEWLKELAGQSLSKYPNYAGYSWFEYNKDGEEDFRVVLDGIAKQVLGKTVAEAYTSSSVLDSESFESENINGSGDDSGSGSCGESEYDNESWIGVRFWVWKG